MTLLGRALRPVLRWLFPSCRPIIPQRRHRRGHRGEHARPQQRRHAAQHQGHGRAAGAQPAQGHGLNAMVTFMALTTSGVQLIPATMIGVLVAAGSKNRRPSSPRR